MSANTNFIQFNPLGDNMESDTAYAADSTRSGGAVDGNVFEATLANKAFYQWSTFIAAFCQMLAEKGYPTSDADIQTLAAVLGNIMTQADIKPALLVEPYGSAITFDCSKANGFQVTLNADVTNASVVNTSPGQVVTFVIIEDGNGGHTFNWPGSVHAPGPISPGNASAGANITNVQQFIARADGTLFPISSLTSN